jgi:hypothetical protein
LILFLPDVVVQRKEKDTPTGCSELESRRVGQKGMIGYAGYYLLVSIQTNVSV